MAVYKSTYCYPFLSSIDPRITLYGATTECEPQYLRCKVDTSNKKVTGYSIRILNSQNEVVFPNASTTPVISPIEELQTTELGYEVKGINSGLNGTFLQIPFFQNYCFPINYKNVSGDSTISVRKSAQALYYLPMLSVDHCIYSGASSSMQNANNWNWVDETTKKQLIYNWADSGIIDSAMRVKTSTASTEATDPLSVNPQPTYFLTKDTDIPDDTIKTVHENRIVVDGEELLEGDIVCVSMEGSETATSGWKTAKSSFYIVTKQETTDETTGYTIIQTILEKFSDEILDEFYRNAYNGTRIGALIVKGVKDHGQVVTFKISGSTIEAYKNSGMPSKFFDINQNSYYFNFTNGSYKWEITLYQGDAVISTQTSIKGSPYATNSYDTTSDNDFDIVVTSGTICGSNGSRIQIANQNPFDESGNPVADTELPSQTDGVLILQGTYAALGQDYSKQFVGANIYIETYDSSYGHAYPMTGAVSDSAVEAAQYIQFFKHSSDPTQILDSDIVDWGISDNVALTVVDTSGKTPSCDPGAETGTPTNLIITISDWSGTIANMSVGQTVLLTGQTNKMTNGVYSYYTSGDYHCLKRAASYTSWSNYIGKIIFVQYGDLAGKNIQSLASAGASFALWNPSTSVKGSSQLWFIEEKPIILFNSQLSQYIIEAFSSSTIATLIDPTQSGVDFSKFGDVTSTPELSKHCLLVLNDYVHDLYWFDTSLKTPQWVYLKEAEDDYYYIRGGNEFSGDVVDVGTKKETYELSSAKVLHNAETYTFISPSINVKSGMRTRVRLDNGSYHFVPIQYVDDVTHAISHPTDTSYSPFKSRSSEALSYEIRSNFKTSDENPFYTNEKPYLIIYKNGKVFNTLAVIQGEEPNQTVPASVVSARSVKLSAKYVNFGGSSWENYRWVLKDSEGNVKQDSGKKYDKDIDVTFYGLFNDSAIEDIVYYATLYIEDELQNTIEDTIKLVVIKGSSTPAQIPFTAQFDRNLQGVKLSYQDNGIFAPSLRNTIERTDNVFTSDSTNFDNSVQYNNSDDNNDYVMQLAHTGKDTKPLVYFEGSNILASDSNVPTYMNMVGASERYGMNYYRRFGAQDSSRSSDETDHNLVIQGNELYFETQFTLGDNFSGQILQFEVQGDEDDSDIVAPYVTDEGYHQSKDGYLTFTLLTIDNFASETNRTALNTDRNKFHLVISKDSKAVASKNTNNLTWFDTTRAVKDHWQSTAIMDGKDIVERANYEFVEIQRDSGIENYIGKFMVSGTTPYYYKGGKYDLGNLGLIAKIWTEESSKTAFTYWIEDQPVLATAAIQTDDYFLDKCSQRLKFTSRTNGTAGGIQKWPETETDEQSQYWYDIYDEANVAPQTWTRTPSETLKKTLSNWLEYITPVDRHPNVSSVSYHFLCKISDVNNLYKASSISINLSDSSDSATFTILSGTSTLGTILLEKVTKATQ